MLQVLYEQYPQLEEQLKSNEHRSGSEADAFEMEVFGGTPLTNAFYLNTCAGEVGVLFQLFVMKAAVLHVFLRCCV